MITSPHWTEDLHRLGACRSAIEWARLYPSPNAAWAACDRGDWMLWAAGSMSGTHECEARRTLTLACCECARLSLHLFENRFPDDKRPREYLEISERWARGNDRVLMEHIHRVVYDSFTRPTYSHESQAGEIARIASRIPITNAASNAASDVAHYVAYVTGNKSALAQCADIVRKYYPTPPSRSMT